MLQIVLSLPTKLKANQLSNEKQKLCGKTPGKTTTPVFRICSNWRILQLTSQQPCGQQNDYNEQALAARHRAICRDCQPASRLASQPGGSSYRLFRCKYPVTNNYIIAPRYATRTTPYLFHGQELQQRKNQMPVQKMCYLGCQIVLRHLDRFQKETLLTKRVRALRHAYVIPFPGLFVFYSY